jgi:hypothetical protein
MKTPNQRYAPTLRFVIAAILAISGLYLGKADEHPDKQQLRGRIVAMAIPGASAISAVGTFLPGGPIHDKPTFAAYTLPGRVLDPSRILVGSSSNFGEPVANADQMTGSFLSIDPRGPAILVIPPAFASAGGQASAMGGMVQIYSAQSPPFRNSIHNPLAATARFTGVSNPLGMSINNAFGRLWPANSPTGLYGDGSSTILDPTGEPLDGAPNPAAGGVFAGHLTPRMPVQVVQAHTLKAVDGIAPVGTISPLQGRRWNHGEDEVGSTSPRLGAILNYSPTRILYVSEPFENSIAAINLTDDGVIFRMAGIRRLRSEALNQPVDLAPADIETTDPNWASNTTLEENADFYVANRGDNTIVRMRQDGTVVAIREVRLANGRALGSGRLNGIAVSPDGSKIWVTVVGQLAGEGNLSGAVLELPSF